MPKTKKDPPTKPLEIAVEEREAWKRRLTITVDADRVALTRRKEREKLGKKLRLKGFRAGKVPARIVEERYGELVDQRTVQRLVETAYEQALRDEQLEPIGQPEVGQVRYTEGENLTFQVDVEIMPELKLGRLGGFRVTRPSVPVEDADVEQVIQRLREERGVWEPAEISPTEGDLVAVRITRTDEATGESGVAISGPGAAEGSDEEEGSELYRFPVGRGYAIPDVEEAITTLSPGSAGRFTVTFPDEFGDPALAGRTHELDIELVEVKRRRLAPLDDAFAADVGDYGSLDELRARVRDDLEAHREHEAEQTVRDQLVDSIIEANPFDVPESLVEGYLERLVGTPDEEAGAESDDERRAEAIRSIRPIAERQLKGQLVLEHLIDELRIEASDEEVEAEIARIAGRRGTDPSEVRRRLIRQEGLDSLRREVAMNKVHDHLRELSTIE